MELKVIEKELPIWIEGEAYSSRSQINLDAVIPDSREDASRVVWAQGFLLLKGKDPTAHSLVISGELSVSVLYQTESGSLDTLRLKKEYEINFELEEPDPEAPPQISSRLVGLEAKLLNPRKLSVSADVQTLVQPFLRDSLRLDASLPENARADVHVLRESRDVLALRSVQEKTFTVREQLQLQPGEVLPRSIAGESLVFSDLESESLGARSIVKGVAELRIWGLDEAGLPVFSFNRLPFSQLVENGDDDSDLIFARAEPSSVYLDWIEGTGGERSLEAELHGVLQVRRYFRQTISSIADAYSTRMPVSVSKVKRTPLRALERTTVSLSGEESFPVPDDAVEFLSSETKLGPLESDREEASLALTADLLYRCRDGSLGSIRRSLHLQGEALEPEVKVRAVRLCGSENALNNGKLTIHGQAELFLERQITEQIETVDALDLREDASWDLSDLPAISLVYSHGESLWELAKEYRSSVETIVSCNPEACEILLIPAE